MTNHLFKNLIAVLQQRNICWQHIPYYYFDNGQIVDQNIHEQVLT